MEQKSSTQSITRKRKLIGVVVSDRMSKTRVVKVTRKKRHPKYLRYYTVSARFKVHDEENKHKVGDEVVLEECRPLSKEKRWRIAGLAREREA